MIKFSKKKILLNVLFTVGVISIIVFFRGQIQSSDEILWLTFLALIWYASETSEMRREMATQNELEQKPIIDLYYRPAKPEHKKYFRLRNSGKGTAYNINVGDLKIDNQSFKFYFEDPNSILIVGEEKTLDIIASYNDTKGNEHTPGDGIEFFFNSVGQKSFNALEKNNFKKISEPIKIEVIIHYENAVKKKFKRFFTIQHDGIMIDQDISIKREFKFNFERYE
ncbi:MAG: hypothetical protein Q7K65_04285 [Candidatus Buchananbacteria bacterium]|nr:hypothetical protein [Candidatus Buchananbacteria bacterium]